jgi:hypothetical protein
MGLYRPADSIGPAQSWHCLLDEQNLINAQVDAIIQAATRSYQGGRTQSTEKH